MKIKHKKKSRGNTKLQHKRRRARIHKVPKYQPELFELIDGNMTHYPKGYCKSKYAWVSIGLYDCHKCNVCMHYEEGVNLG